MAGGIGDRKGGMNRGIRIQGREPFCAMEDAGRGICTRAVAGELVGTLPSKSISP